MNKWLCILLSQPALFSTLKLYPLPAFLNHQCIYIYCLLCDPKETWVKNHHCNAMPVCCGKLFAKDISSFSAVAMLPSEST